MSITIGGSFSLTDHHGRAVTEASFHGKFALLFFGFTHCKVVCPRALSRLSGALDLLGDLAEEIQPLYITVDPDRDTPEVMRTFLETNYPRFLGLTGDKVRIDEMKAAYKVFAQRREDPDNPDGYDMPHTAFTFLLDREGDYLAHFIDAGDTREFADKLRARLEARGV